MKMEHGEYPCGCVFTVEIIDGERLLKHFVNPECKFDNGYHPAIKGYEYRPWNERRYWKRGVEIKLIENTRLSLEECRWCGSCDEPHSRACPLGERYAQTQNLCGVGA